MAIHILFLVDWADVRLYVQGAIGNSFLYKILSVFLIHSFQVTPMATKLPFVDADSEQGFLINTAHQLGIATVAIIG